MYRNSVFTIGVEDQSKTSSHDSHLMARLGSLERLRELNPSC